MKVAFFVSNYPSVVYPSRGIFFKRLSEGLIKQFGIKVAVVTPMPYSNSIIEMFIPSLKGLHRIPVFEELNGVEIYRPRYIRLPFAHKFMVSHWFMLYRVKQIIKKIKPDLIDFRTSYPTYPLSRLVSIISSSYKIPFIYSINGLHRIPHEDTNKRRKGDFIKMLISASKIQSVTNELKFSIELMTKIPVTITIHPLEINEVYKESELIDVFEKRKLDRNRIYFLYAGQLSYEKGVDILLEGFRALNNPNITLLLAGDGNLMNSVVAENIIFLGPVKPAEIYALMKITSLFFLLSREEGMPNVLKEAGLFKLPVIGTRAGGIPEILDNGNRGWILEKWDKDALVELIQNVLLNPSESKVKGEKLSEHVLERYSVPSATQKLYEVYNEVLRNI